jgi:hypothetical protein
MKSAIVYLLVIHYTVPLNAPIPDIENGHVREISVKRSDVANCALTMFDSVDALSAHGFVVLNARCERITE